MEGAAPSAPKYLGHDGACPSRMNLENESGRKQPAHTPIVERHNELVIIFLTVCSKDRKRIFAAADAVQIIVNAWRDATSWLVGRYVIMPNHIHLFCAPGVFPSESLHQWVRYWKNLASRHWPRPNEHPIWQRDFWDTQLRRHENYDSKWDYVINNPVRAGLVEKSEDWPFHGERNILPW
jgi:putative transposase